MEAKRTNGKEQEGFTIFNRENIFGWLLVSCEIFKLELETMKRELISEKFANKVYYENVDETVFKLAEQKVKYLIKNDKH